MERRHRHGRLRRRGRKPAAGAVVALLDSGAKVTAMETIGTDGHFRVKARAGMWGISAHHPSGAGAFFDPREFSSAAASLGATSATNPTTLHSRVVITAREWSLSPCPSHTRT